MSWQMWLAFSMATLMYSLSPGAAAIAAMSGGVNYGFRHGYWVVIGLQLGLLLEVCLVVAGLGVLLATSNVAFNVVKWAGVAYLVYLAISQWRMPPRNYETQAAPEIAPSAFILIWRGFLTNMTNPKAIIFLAAVMPQFLTISQPLAAQYSAMAATSVVIDLVVMAVYALGATKLLVMLKTAKQQRWLNRSFSAMFAGSAGALTTI